MEYHENIANMLFIATILTFVVLTMYAFVYTNYRKPIKKYLALQLNLPGCHYYESDSDDSDDEVLIKEEAEQEQTQNVQLVRKESVLARL